MTEAVYQNAKPLSRDLFIESLSDRITQVEKCWEGVLDTRGGKNEIADTIGAVHYLAGGAAVYGFISLSKQAYRVIDLLKPCLNTVAFTREIEQGCTKILTTIREQESYFRAHADRTDESTCEPTLNEASCQNIVSNVIYTLENSPEEEMALRVFLENTGFALRSFKSLHKLHKALEEEAPRAVILDLEQSNEDTTAPVFITALLDQSIHVPVFVLADSGDFETRLKAARLNTSHFFVKPVDGFKLVDTIHSATPEIVRDASRVLLVDDDPETAAYVALHLKKEGLIVQVLNDPSKTLDTISEFCPDLIVSDLYMPECNGFELATIIRQHELYYDIPIVFLTSETEADSRLKALKLGSDDFFNKSMDIELIAKAITSRLQRMNTYSLVKKAMLWSPN